MISARPARLALLPLVAVLAACASNAPRAIDPNDRSQFENLPPAPPVETVAAAPVEVTPPAAEPAAVDLGTGIETTTAPLAAPVAAPANDADLLAIRKVYFDTDLSDIKAISIGALSAHARNLANQPAARLQLSGHADERGTREYNLALGERRANAVARFLVSQGAKAEQLTVVSYGKERPAVEGSDETAWSQNRRVEMDYVSAQ